MASDVLRHCRKNEKPCKTNGFQCFWATEPRNTEHRGPPALLKHVMTPLWAPPGPTKPSENRRRAVGEPFGATVTRRNLLSSTLIRSETIGSSRRSNQICNTLEGFFTRLNLSLVWFPLFRDGSRLCTTSSETRRHRSHSHFGHHRRC